MIGTLVEIEHIKDFDEQGFFSKTYLGHDPRLKIDVAVKDIIPHNLKSEDDFDIYFEEAHKLSIATHPRILPVYYVGFDKDSKKTPRIVTKYMKNGSLQALLEGISNSHSLKLDEIIKYAHEIIQGLIHLHSLNIIHLDLKASNIFIGDDNKLVLADFGQAKFIEEEVLLEVNNLYPIINPPENIKSRVIDKTSDIYQFGVLLYSIACFVTYRNILEKTYGVNTSVLSRLFKEKDKKDYSEEDQKAFDDFRNNAKELSKKIRKGLFSEEDFLLFLPQKLVEIINKCMQIDVKERYQSFYQVQQDLNTISIPEEVIEIYQDFENNHIHFEKNGIKCKIEVEEQQIKKKICYNILPFKSGKNFSSSKGRKNVSLNKLRIEIYKVMSDL